MKNKPVEVSYIGKKDEDYLLEFLHLQAEVAVNKELFQKMIRSNEYNFVSKDH